MAGELVGLDAWGRLVIPGETGMAAGPVIPPLPDDHNDRRSGKWPAFLRELLREFPTCWGCGRKAATGHHELPFHLYPAYELDPDNVLIVCLPCHFVLCHAGDWRLYVDKARSRLSSNLRAMKAIRAAKENQ